MLAVLLLQTSLLARPMYLSDAPPPLRSARNVTVYFQSDASGAAPVPTTRSREEALALGEDFVARLRAGVDFRQLAQERSEAANAASGGMLGTFAQGMLAPELDRYLFAAAEGEISDPLVTGSAVHVLQRIETHAAVLQIFATGSAQSPEAHAAARTRAEGWLAKLRAGTDFSALAREVSEDAPSAKRGGEFAIYERGVRDTLLKAAAFEIPIGETSGLLESPLGWHVIKRVALGELDPQRMESNFARMRAILFPFDTAHGADVVAAPTQAQAKQAAERVAQRLDAGEDMAALAREHDGDAGGKERAGDLGWIYRFTPDLLPALRDGFYMQRGERTRPLATAFGYVILKREE